MNSKTILAVIAAMMLVLTGCMANGIDPAEELTYDEAIEQLNAHLDPDKGDVRYNVVSHQPDNSWVGVDTTEADLPEIDTYPLSVRGDADLVVEIASSTEKSSKDGSGWLDRMAKEFNRSGAMVDGQRVAVSIRPIASGSAYSYMTTGKYVPDAYSPANELWTPMIEAAGVDVQLVEKRLTGNVAGILMSEAAYEAFTTKHGKVTVPNVVKAVTAGEMKLGHTDPNLSSTGLNMLLEELKSMDETNLLSDQAVTAYRAFQADALKPSLTTDEMSEVAVLGLQDAMIMESQAWKNRPELATGWVFEPAGVRHDSPLYALNRLDASKLAVLDQFANFVQTDEAQQLASKLGFNQYDGYAGVQNELSGAQIAGALGLWKLNKEGDASVVSVIVVDHSGSMEGAKIEQARQALLAGASEINPGSHVGMITYGSDITVDLPIGEWTNQQRSLFTGAVNSITPRGGTATNSAIVAALHLMTQYEVEGQVKYRIILISDGQQNEGINLKSALQVIGGLGASVNTISFETGSTMDSLESLSRVGREAASVTYADSSDVRLVFKNMARNAL